MNTVYIGLGSNLGEREENIKKSIDELSGDEDITLLKKSGIYETVPLGHEEQPHFLNAAVAIQTTLQPYDLLEKLKGIEQKLGRKQTVKWGPRVIDIDILLYDDEIHSDDKLTIPHPLMHERYFVLKPLADIAPEVVHPILDETIKELYEQIALE
ncbi:2-amino-4-hydroxy-6-hydroxymethyldihydropteridine diphosphokinase [Candidatus Margulisiibacteriota bacterium]